MGEYTSYYDARVSEEPPILGIEKHDTPQPRSTYVDFAVTEDASGWVVISEEGVRSVAVGDVEITEEELETFLRHAVTAWRAAFQDFETDLGLQFELDFSPLQACPTLLAVERDAEGQRTQFRFGRTEDGRETESTVTVSSTGIETTDVPPSLVRHAVTAWRVTHREFTTSLS